MTGIIALHPITDAEWDDAVTWMRLRWPGAAAWSAATLEAYRQDVRAYSAGQVMRALERYYRRGRVAPPNAGQLVHEIDTERADGVVDDEPKPTREGPPPGWHDVQLADEIEQFGREHHASAEWFAGHITMLERHRRMDAAFDAAFEDTGGDVRMAMRASLEQSAVGKRIEFLRAAAALLREAKP